jgi:hypothetical protein
MYAPLTDFQKRTIILYGDPAMPKEIAIRLERAPYAHP